MSATRTTRAAFASADLDTASGSVPRHLRSVQFLHNSDGSFHVRAHQSEFAGAVKAIRAGIDHAAALRHVERLERRP